MLLLNKMVMLTQFVFHLVYYVAIVLSIPSQTVHVAFKLLNQPNILGFVLLFGVIRFVWLE